jgi:hypothetical protein
LSFQEGFFYLFQGPEIAQAGEVLARVVLVIVFCEVRLQCLFLTCRRRKVDQLYCPKHWEFTNHVECSGDFLCTLNDLYFVVFVLYYMFIPLSCCKLMPLELFPRVSSVRSSAAQAAMAIKKRVRVPGIDLELPLPRVRPWWLKP